MNRNFIISIIFLLSLATIGIAYLQIKLIRQGVELREKQFDSNVYSVLNRTAYHLEQLYAIKKINNQHNNIEKLSSQLGKKLLTKLGIEQNGVIDKNFVGTFEINDPNTGAQLQIKIDTQNGVQTIQYLNKSDGDNDPINDFFIKSGGFGIQESGEELKDVVSKAEVEATIANELRSAGIKTKYQYSLFNPATYNTIYSNIDKMTPKIFEESYPIAIYNNLFGNELTLLLYFPKKDLYILTNLWMMLTESIVFIGVILFCFGACLFIIYRQKKLSDLTTDFINNMTHELKTPVATITLAGEMLKNQKVLSDIDKARNYAGIILEENNRLSSHIERVLQFAKYDRGQIELKKESFDIHEIIQDVLDSSLLRIQSLKGEVVLHLNASNSLLYADKHHIHNVLNNIIDNAIKYTGSNPLHIEVNTFNKSDGIIIVIKDNGIGMNKDTQKKIFEKFYRVPTGNVHDVKGFGLGLSYVKAMIEAHHGHVSVQSELNKGSSFELYLPIKEM
ncbi:MAG: HAMP domain-containing sensor histidine kinase [Bacteroidota bacterium]